MWWTGNQFEVYFIILQKNKNKNRYWDPPQPWPGYAKFDQQLFHYEKLNNDHWTWHHITVDLMKVSAVMHFKYGDQNSLWNAVKEWDHTYSFIKRQVPKNHDCSFIAQEKKN